jgi:hypothetical protein
MSQETKTVKDKMFMHGRDTVEETRDGELSIMANKPEKELQDVEDTDS